MTWWPTSTNLSVWAIVVRGGGSAVLCSWCDDPAAFFMLIGGNHGAIDRACDVHMIRWRGAYDRTLKLPGDVRGGATAWSALELARA